MGNASRFDSAPLQEALEVTNPRWRQWFQDLWRQVNKQALPLPTAITVGASPFVYQYTGAGNASIVVNGGGVTLVEFSRDGTTWYQVGGAGAINMYHLSQGDYLRVTYGALPVMAQILM